MLLGSRPREEERRRAAGKGQLQRPQDQTGTDDPQCNPVRETRDFLLGKFPAFHMLAHAKPQVQRIA